jgi:hypothetical protein
MLLDKFMSVYHFNEVHAVVARATPERIFRAIKEVTPQEMPLVRTLFWMRSLPALLTGRGGSRLGGAKAVLEQALSGGFVLLAEETNRELVLGTIDQFWKLQGGSSPQIASAQEFLAFDHPDYAKAALNFYVDENSGEDGVKVTTETRVYVPNSIARSKFAAYWRVIYPGSALIRKMWLRAIKRRAEQG